MLVWSKRLTIAMPDSLYRYHKQLSFQCAAYMLCLRKHSSNAVFATGIFETQHWEMTLCRGWLVAVALNRLTSSTFRRAFCKPEKVPYPCSIQYAAQTIPCIYRPPQSLLSRQGRRNQVFVGKASAVHLNICYIL
jgi:hypothetical protein